jgi:uncharacterized damage-inducible protein DinB
MTTNMPFAKQALLMEVNYSAWANRQLLQGCAALTEEERERDLGASHGSVVGTLRHIYYSERVWWRRLCANALPPMIEMGDQRLFQDPAPEPGFDALLRKWPSVWNGMHAWLANIPELELKYELGSRMPNGDEFRVSRWKIILHSVNHSTLHRGQVMSMLRTLGHRPPNTDIFSFYMEEGSAYTKQLA